MSDKAQKISIANRSLICGVGINDADYITTKQINGKIIRCPFYQKWRGMLTRCYDKKTKDRFPTYNGCSVVEEWLTFSNFKKWMESQNWQGKELDKDIIEPGNKIYSPKTCVFVDRYVNGLLVDSAGKRGKYPIGVYFQKDRRKFASRCNIKGKKELLGRFDTCEDAFLVYKKAKHDEILRVAGLQSDIKVIKGLHLHAKMILEMENHDEKRSEKS
ncbi:MAG: hypothetical protein KAT69_01680 [Candidatus Aminicenantes bacterium]|nr:hypothetical protein [Candidatus Aminicenantes bacterium]